MLELTLVAKSIGYNQFFRIIASVTVLTATYLTLLLQLVDVDILFWMIVISFLSLTWLEYKFSRHPFFSLPPTYYSLTMAFYIFLSGIFYFSFDQSETTQFYVTDEFIFLAGWYTLASIQILWIGFYLFSDRRYHLLNKLGFKAVPMWLINFFVCVFLLSFVVGVNTGNFGYVADQDNLGATNFIRFGLQFGLIAIALLAIFHYESKNNRRYLYAIVVINMLVGVLFGSKSAVVTPLLILILTNYLCGRKLKLSLVFGVLGAIIMAYLLIEPFRIYYEMGGGSSLTVSELVNTFYAARSLSEGSETNYVESFFTRISYVTAVGKTIEFAEINGYYRNGEWRDVLLSPLYGAIPRFIWESKPLADFGLWASANIFELPPTTHTGILPAGYSYLVFRLPGILIFFLLYGIIQRFGFNLFFLSRGLMPVYIYFYLFALYPSYPVWTSISTFTQSIILTFSILFLAALFRKKNYIVP
jgi:hypothetical protein